jgi:mono/diheme cytochrome c family protein
MAYQGLENDEIADVMNYILNQWGNSSKNFITTLQVDEINKSILEK